MTDDLKQRLADAEVAVLGGLLLGGDVDKVAEHIGGDEHAWGRDAHRILWEAILAVHQAGRTPETLTVLEELRTSGLVEAVGGPVALTDAAAAAPGAWAAPDWAQVVAEGAHRRRLLAAGRRAVADSADPTVDPWAAFGTLTGVAGRAPAPGGGLTVVSGRNILDVPAPDWVVGGWWPQGTSMLWGRRSSGKTFIALSVAVAVASGRDWWSNPVGAPGDVLYCAAEGRGGVARRLEAATGSDVSQLDRLHLIGDPFQLTSSRDVARLDRAISAVVPTLVVIDTWGRLSGLDNENDNASTNQLVAQLDRLRDRHDCSWLIVHHSSADDSKARGATALEDGVDASGRVTYDTQSKVIDLESAKPPKDAPPPPRLQFRLRQHGPSAVLERVVGDRGRTNADELAGELFGLLQSATVVAVSQATARFGLSAVERARAHPDVVEFVDSDGVPRLKHRQGGPL